eukprot:g746.t1
MASLRVKPVQVGTVRWEGDACVFEGVWAINEDDFQKGITSKFRYQAKAPSSETNKSVPLSAMYDGYFFMKTAAPEPMRIAESNIFIRFVEEEAKTPATKTTAEESNSSSVASISPSPSKKYRVEGRGKNGWGSFVLEGTYSGSDGKLRLYKMYEPKKANPTKEKEPRAKSGKKNKALKNFVAPYISSYRRTKSGKKVMMVYFKGEVICPTEPRTESFVLAGKWALNKKDFEAGIVAEFRYESKPGSRSEAYASLFGEEKSGTASDGNSTLAVKKEGAEATIPKTNGALQQEKDNTALIRAIEEDDLSTSGLISEEFRGLMKHMTGIYNGFFNMKGMDGESRNDETNVLFRFHKQTHVVSGGQFNSKSADVKSATQCTVSARGKNAYGKFEMLGSYNFQTRVIELSKQYVPKPQPKKKRTPKPKKAVAVNGTLTPVGALHLSPSSSSTDRPSRKRKAPKKMLASQEEEFELNRLLNGNMLKCGMILNHVMKMPAAEFFNAPVDPVLLKLPDYRDIVKHPMDLGTIMKGLRAKAYKTPEDVKKDVDLVWANSFLYNKPTTYVHKATAVLKERFEKKWRPLQKRLDAARMKEEAELAEKEARKADALRRKAEAAERRKTAATEKAERKRKRAQEKKARPRKRRPSGSHPYKRARGGDGADSAKYSALEKQLAALQAKLEAIESGSVAMAKPKKPKAKRGPKPLTFEEKRMLSISINDLPGAKLSRVLQIISESMPISEQGDLDTITIDIDSMDTKTLRRLQKYVRSVLAPKKKGAKKALMKQAERVSESTAQEIRELEQKLAASGSSSNIPVGTGNASVGGGARDDDDGEDDELIDTSSSDDDSSSGEEQVVESGGGNSGYSTFY